MRVFISKKLSFILLLCAYCAASGIILLLHYVFTGPGLGRVYDILLGFRSPAPVSGEILMIETGEIIEPGDIFSVLMTSSEMGASDLLVEVRVLGTGSGRAESGEEISLRISDEFSLLERNIRNLFEAIRLGLVPPPESPAYVENLVELTERGRDRLKAAVVRQDEAGSVQAAQAAQVFGRAIAAADLQPQPLGETSWYSRPRPDPDGILRRIAPVIAGEKSAAIEHIVYHALKPRWPESVIEHTEAGLVLINRFERQGDEYEHRFVLDRNGNILFEKPGKNNGFRRVNLNHFLDYDRADRTMVRLLKDAVALGVYTEIMPERIPYILFDYAESIREELLKAPDAEKRALWISARDDYIASLDEFLYGPSEMILVNGYEELIADEAFDEDGVIKLQNLRDVLIRSFVSMREKHRELIELRGVLAQVLDSSFCVMGPADSAAGIPESSALFANALLTGHSVTPGQNRYILLWSFAVSFAVLACIHMLGPAALLAAGFLASLLCGAGFGVSFILNGYWIDPLIPAAACLCGTLVLVVSRFCIGYGRDLRFRLAYGPSVNKKMLRQLVSAGRPRLTETVCVRAAIIAVKKPGLSGREDREKPVDAARAAAEFRETFSRIFKRAGALALNFEGDTALACFGSPPERIYLKKIKSTMRYTGGPENPDGTDPALKAALCVTELLKNRAPDINTPPAEWCFGIESGECAFSWSGETGYTVNGRPVVRAKIFASLAPRYQVRAIIGGQAREGAGLKARKLAALDNSGVPSGGYTASENFYKLPLEPEEM